MNKRFLIGIIVTLLLSGCSSPPEKIEVSGTVTGKEYKAAYTTLLSSYDSSTKTTKLKSHHHSEKYLVTVSYKEIVETFNDQDLYESVKEGDSIEVMLYEYYSRDGDLIEQSLVLPESSEP